MGFKAEAFGKRSYNIWKVGSFGTGGRQGFGSQTGSSVSKSPVKFPLSEHRKVAFPTDQVFVSHHPCLQSTRQVSFVTLPMQSVKLTPSGIREKSVRLDTSTTNGGWHVLAGHKNNHQTFGTTRAGRTIASWIVACELRATSGKAVLVLCGAGQGCWARTVGMMPPLVTCGLKSPHHQQQGSRQAVTLHISRLLGLIASHSLMLNIAVWTSVSVRFAQVFGVHVGSLPLNT